MSSRPVKRRTVTRPTTSRAQAMAKAGATRTPSPHMVKPKPAHNTSAPIAVPATQAAAGATLAIVEPPKLTIGDRAAALREKARAQHERFIKSIESVQAPSSNAKPRPRWFKIATWLIMLMPAYAIGIYLIGFFILGSSAAQNTGLAKSFAITPTTTVGDVLVPNTEGIFLQATSGSQEGLALINDFPSRSLQPPQSAQVTLKPSQLRYVLIREAQVDLPGDYQVFRIKDGAPDVPVTVSALRVHVPGIALVSISMPKGQAWPAGEYMIVIPEAGLDDENSLVFFTVS